jgi:hypothetical protein
VIESFVDLTYRGISLGRRIKLGQVRPSSGYLELATPMPVGTHVAIASDDGVTIEATVTWVYEQVAGSDRAPGMIVAPALAAEPAASWWKARVALPDDEAPRARAPRPRPVTVRPRPKTLSTPPPVGAVADEVPTIIADLDARVAAAAGLAPPRPAGDRADLHSAVMSALDQAHLEQLARSPDAEATVQSTGEHIVIDDGHQTILMEAIDPSDLGIEARGGDPGAGGEPGGGAGRGAAGDDDSEVTEVGVPGEPAGNAPPPGGAGGRR